MMRLMAVMVLSLFLTSASAAHAASYWIDASKSASGGCGLSAATACPDWATLMGDRNCPACGCGSGGCRRTISSSTTADSINFVAGGLWHGNGGGTCIGVNFLRSVGRDLVIQCTDRAGTYAPGQCSIDRQGVNVSGPFPALLGLGMSGCDSVSPATYVQWKGINILAGSSSASGGLVGIKGGSSTHHILVADATLDGGTALNGNNIQTDSSESYLTFKGITSTNCNGGGGCMDDQNTSHVAKVGNTLGPRLNFPNATGNQNDASCNDCDTFLWDGNTARGMGDGFDPSMTSTTQVGHGIIRYNVVYDMWGNQNQADHHFKYSGDNPTGSTTLPSVWYKNVGFYATKSRFAGIVFFTERAQNGDFWYNTFFSTDGFLNGDPTQQNVYAEATGNSSGNFPFLYNILDGTNTGRTVPNTIAGNTACSASACRWVGNAIWFAERGTGSCVRFKTSDLGDDTFNCDLSQQGGGPDFNGIGANRRNIHANPNFANRAAAANGTTDPAVFRLTASSAGYVDAGDAFCHASAGGSGNTITVSCGPGTGAGAFQDAQHYFPDPNDYYALANADCAGRGTRSVEANGSAIGCYDIQIQGCGGGGGLGNLPGVRTITSVTANQISFSGPACSWANGAMVHVPWTGAAPDLGAIEFSGGIPAPQLVSVVPVS